MNKSELIRYVMDNTDLDLNQRQASELVNTVFTGMKSALQEEGSPDNPASVRINGFGTFQVRRQKERISYGFNLTQGDNPAPVRIEARRTVHFRASDLLKDALR